MLPKENFESAFNNKSCCTLIYQWRKSHHAFDAQCVGLACPKLKIVALIRFTLWSGFPVLFYFLFLNFEGPETPPKNFTASAISSKSAHLSWLPPPREHRNGLIRHFWINITEINTGRKFTKTLSSTATVLSSLHPYYTYQFSVAAYTVGLGPFTTAIVLKMPQDGETVYYLK